MTEKPRRNPLRLVLLPGDGIGPEIVRQADKVLTTCAQRFDLQLQVQTHMIGGEAIDATGSALPEETVAACQQADAVLLGAVGGPKWDNPNASVRPEQGLLGLRRTLGVYANLRPVKVVHALAHASPLKADILAAGVDLLVVRELTGGLYFGQPKGRSQQPEGWRAIDTLVYEEHEIRRILRLAFELAAQRRGQLTSIDKANVLESSRLWRQLATEMAADYPQVHLEHQLVDSAAMRLVTTPSAFDVVVTENMFGDILSDEAAVLTGSLGLLPSASLGEGHVGLYEPIHGSAPDIAGQDMANPLGTILSAALLLRHSGGHEEAAQAIEKAVYQVLSQGLRTRDLASAQATSLGCHAMGDAVVSVLSL